MRIRSNVTGAILIMVLAAVAGLTTNALRLSSDTGIICKTVLASTMAGSDVTLSAVVFWKVANE